MSVELVCSARGCRQRGGWALRWNNPRLHPPERRKTWLACDEHREHLAEYLSVRGFLRETVPSEELPPTSSSPSPTPSPTAPPAAPPASAPEGTS